MEKPPAFPTVHIGFLRFSAYLTVYAQVRGYDDLA